MKASEMIATIKYVEENHHRITKMHASRINYFQRQNLPETQGVTYDEPSFSDFIKEMEKEVKKVNIPTAKKILNNWYVWAKNNLQALSKIEPFAEADNAIDWLIKNNFRVDHKCFAESATEELIAKVKEQMPQNSELYAKLKSTADKQHVGKRGFSYPYLVKVVAGFSEAWN